MPHGASSLVPLSDFLSSGGVEGRGEPLDEETFAEDATAGLDNNEGDLQEIARFPHHRDRARASFHALGKTQETVRRPARLRRGGQWRAEPRRSTSR